MLLGFVVGRWVSLVSFILRFNFLALTSLFLVFPHTRLYSNGRRDVVLSSAWCRYLWCALCS